MATHDGTPLAGVPGWKQSYVEQLAASWITTAEQVVGMAATPQGVQSLAQQLGLSEKEMKRLLAQARAALPPSVASELSRQVDTSEYGLGALPPDQPD